MRSPNRIAATAFVFFAAHAVATLPPGVEDLVPRPACDVDYAWIRPGADFRPYGRILLEKVEVALGKDWLRDVNRDRASLSARWSAEDARRIVESVRASFDEAWEETFRAAGYEIVSTPGEGVLQVRPSLVELALNAPSGGATGIARSYAREAGEATLNLELRESRSGVLLARMVDRRATMRNTRPQLMLEATNRGEFSRLFAAWARDAAGELRELATISPLPARSGPPG